MLIRATIALAAIAGVTAPLAGGAPDGPPPLDVLIAIDTTGSMTPSIEQAKRDAREVVRDTQEALPGARFAVAQFRDAGDRPVYELVQDLTPEPDRVAGAMTRLYADGGGDSPEAYAEVFRRAAAPGGVAWREGARRLLVVIGDAEPHGAGAAGIAGCADRSPDPLGGTVTAALAGLRAESISLAMILQASSASTGIGCYRSLANLAFGQGSARLSGDGATGVTPARGGPEGTGSAAAAPALRTALRDAIRATMPTARLVRRGASWRVVLANPTPDAVRASSVRVVLPAGARVVPGSVRGPVGGPVVRRGAAVEWRMDAEIAPGGAAAVRFRVAGSGPGRGTATAGFLLPGGVPYVA